MPLSDHSAGGDIGERFAGNPLGVLAWLVIGAATFALVWPEGASRIVQNAPGWAQEAWAWRLPQKAGYQIRRGFEFIFPMRPAPKGSVKVPIETEMWARTAGATVAAEEMTEDAEEEPVQAPLFPELDEDDGAPAVTVDESGNRRSRDGWQLPAMDLLADKVPAEAGTADNAQRAMLIEETLASFGVDARVVQMNEGPTVTQFGIEPGWEIKTRTLVERDRENKPVTRQGRPAEDARRGSLADARARTADHVAGERPGAGAGSALNPHRGAGAGQAGRSASRCRTRRSRW